MSSYPILSCVRILPVSGSGKLLKTLNIKVICIMISENVVTCFMLVWAMENSSMAPRCQRCLSLKECEGCEFVAPNNWYSMCGTSPLVTSTKRCSRGSVVSSRTSRWWKWPTNTILVKQRQRPAVWWRVWGRKIQHYCLWRISVNDYGKVEILSLAMMQTSLMLRGDDQLLQSRGRGADQGSDHGGGPGDRGPVRGLLLRTLRRHQRGHYRASATRAR